MSDPAEVTQGITGLPDPTSYAGGDDSNAATKGYVDSESGGVDSLAKSGDTPLTGDVTLSAGSNVTLTESGNDIQINASITGSGFSDDLLPWLIDIDVFATAAANTNWDTLSQDISGGAGPTYGADKRTNGSQNAEIGWDVVLAAGTWAIELMHITANNRGIYTIAFDGASVGTVDGYSSGFVADVRSSVTGITVATTGKVRLTLKMATKNGSSGSYYGILQHVRLMRTA